MENEYKYIVIDANCLCWTSFYAMGKLSFNEEPTGIIFGFFQQLYKIAQTFNNSNFVFCWDSQRNFRKLVIPSYKRKDKTEEEKTRDVQVFDQFTALRMVILPYMGYKNNFIQTGYEADDIIASIVINQDNDRCLIASKDADLYQLLNHCDFYDIKTKMIIDADRFKDIYGIDCSQWAMVKAIGGCESDKLDGVPGVAEKTAIKYLRGEMNTATATYKKIIDDEENTKTRLTLTKLPFNGPVPLNKLMLEECPQLNFNYFTTMCEHYDFQSILRELPAWKTVFSMEEIR